jgi:Zn-dependent metalloprotease
VTSRCALHCILPPYVVEHMARSPDPRVRARARELAAEDAEARSVRASLALVARSSEPHTTTRKKRRLVYDLEHQGLAALPGKLVRSEGEPATGDPAADEAYRHAGTIHDFFRRVFERNSLDDRGMALVSSVHLRRDHNNAYWNGEQMVYGDGDGEMFVRFTKALDVVGHELAHGVVSHTCNLVYRDEPGALNEHFADVFGVLAQQWKRKQPAERATWTVGAAILGPKVEARGLRTFEAGRAYADDPLLGTDPQPKHYDALYRGDADYGGVHINSGIPNHAFYRLARELGGNAWEVGGSIWYGTLSRLKPSSRFADLARETCAVAQDRFGARVAAAVERAWGDVGL